MDLTIYDIIIKPHVTTKAYYLNQAKQLVVEIHPQANKPLVVQALKKLFNVETDKVRIIVSKGKFRRVGRHSVQGIMKKKAIVTLKKGYSIDLMGLNRSASTETMPTEKK